MIENPFFSLDIGSVVFSLFVIVLWIGMIRVIVSTAAKILLTVVALGALLWLMGMGGDIVRIMDGILNTIVWLTYSAWNWIKSWF